MSDIKRFFKHSSIYAIGNIINRIGAFLLLPVYTNYLTVSEYGVIEIFYVISSVVSGFLAIGLAHATLRFYFDYQNEKDRHAVVSTNLIGSFSICTLGSVFVAIAATNIVTHVFHNTVYVTGIYIILITLIFELSSQICLAYIRAMEYSTFFVGVSIVKLIIQISINSYLVIVEGAGVTGVLIGNMITVIVGWAVLSAFTVYKCGIRFHLDKFIPVLKYSFPFLLSTIMALIASNVDKFTLNYMVSIEALGIYALALKFSMIIEQLVGEPFSRSYGAFRYTIMHKDDADKMQASIVKYLFIITIIISLSVSYFAGDILYVMSSEAFWPAASIVPLVIVSSIIKIMIYPEQSGILFSKNTKYIFYFTSVAAVVSVIANIVFIYFFDLVGACLALIITDLTVLIMTHKVSRKYFPVNYEYKAMFMVVIVGMVFFAIPYALPEIGLIQRVLVKICLICVVVYILYKLPILSLDEKLRLYNLIKYRVSKK